MTSAQIVQYLLSGLWIAISAWGLYLADHNRRRALANMKALGDLVNGRRLVAISDIRRERMRMVIMADFVLIGVLGIILEIGVFRSALLSFGLVFAAVIHILLIRADSRQGDALILLGIERDIVRDDARDLARDEIRDAARDLSHDQEVQKQ